MQIENLGFKELSYDERGSINGGGDGNFFYDIAYAVGYVAHSIYVMGVVGGAYQQSLPSSLKK